MIYNTKEFPVFLYFPIQTSLCVSLLPPLQTTEASFWQNDMKAYAWSV